MATAEKGRLLFEAETQRLAAFLDEFRRREIQPRRDLHTQPGSKLKEKIRESRIAAR